MAPRHVLVRVIPLFSLLIGVLPPQGAAAFETGEWRPLTREEKLDRPGNDGSEGGPWSVSADFDGDGIRDRAEILVRRSDGERGLVVTLKEKAYVLAFAGRNRKGINADLTQLKDVELGIVEPGRHRPNCFDDCESNPPKPFVLRHPGIRLIDDTATIYYFWDLKRGRFDGRLMVH